MSPWIVMECGREDRSHTQFGSSSKMMNPQLRSGESHAYGMSGEESECPTNSCKSRVEVVSTRPDLLVPIRVGLATELPTLASGLSSSAFAPDTGESSRGRI